MKIEKTSDITAGNNIVMIIYGQGGVGKTTFGASAPNALILDFENGSKYLGSRGIDCDVIRFSEWITTEEKKDLATIIEGYDSIVIDPIGEAMEKLIDSKEIQGQKFRQADGSLTMSGWGEVKKQMRNFVKWLRDSVKNVVLISHVKEIQGENGVEHRIHIATGLSDELPTMVDIISYCGVKKAEGDEKTRVLYTPATGGSFESKDRTGTIPQTVEISEQHGWDDLINSMVKKEADPQKEQK